MRVQALTQFVVISEDIVGRNLIDNFGRRDAMVQVRPVDYSMSSSRESWVAMIEGNMVSASVQGNGPSEREIAMMERIFREELQKRTLLREYYPNMDPADWVSEYLVPSDEAVVDYSDRYSSLSNGCREGLQERYVARAIANWLNDKFAQTDFGQLRSNLIHRMKNDTPKHHFRSTKESTKRKGKVTRSIHEEWGLRAEAFADEKPLECDDPMRHSRVGNLDFLARHVATVHVDWPSEEEIRDYQEKKRAYDEKRVERIRQWRVVSLQAKREGREVKPFPSSRSPRFPSYDRNGSGQLIRLLIEILRAAKGTLSPNVITKVVIRVCPRLVDEYYYIIARIEEGTEHFDRERVSESQSVDVLDIVVDSELVY